jgi:phage shock protein C
MGCNIFAANERLHLEARLTILRSGLLWSLLIETVEENRSISGSNSTWVFLSFPYDSKALFIMKKLYRSETNKRLAGVCGGIGEMLDVDPTIIRVATVVLALVTGIFPFAVGYIIAWLVFPIGKQEASQT